MPHAADLRIVAWAPSRSECLRQVIIGLVHSIAELSTAPVTRTITRTLRATDHRADIVSRVLDEVIYLLDVDASLPVDARVTEIEGGYQVSMWVAAITDIELSVTPKAVPLQDLYFDYDGTAWLCTVTIDV